MSDLRKYEVRSSGVFSVLEGWMTGEGSTQVIPPQPKSGGIAAGGGMGNPGTREANMRSISGVFASPTIMYHSMNNL